MQFAGASGDFSPLHTDEIAARAAGLPTIMAHGMMTLGASVRVVTDWFGDDAMRTLDVRFTAPVWPGDRLTTTATVRTVDLLGALALIRIEVVTRNGAGAEVLLGEAGVAIGNPADA